MDESASLRLPQEHAIPDERSASQVPWPHGTIYLPNSATGPTKSFCRYKSDEPTVLDCDKTGALAALPSLVTSVQKRSLCSLDRTNSGRSTALVLYSMTIALDKVSLVLYSSNVLRINLRTYRVAALSLPPMRSNPFYTAGAGTGALP